ncbi:hypothetical protein HPP92_020187 [Vanilla planifolia]|uniref:Uncharacterized protein n=1 Tax=Vanilla planifolia TaxID=51239 RepID=A0A835QBT9_VANPL|nr:hypothetical protein HPP92_020187 [Vanilla planifolia]
MRIETRPSYLTQARWFPRKAAAACVFLVLVSLRPRELELGPSPALSSLPEIRREFLAPAVGETVWGEGQRD